MNVSGGPLRRQVQVANGGSSLEPTGAPRQAACDRRRPRPGAAEEEELLARLAAGERGEPVAVLYGLYGARLSGLGMRLLGDPGMAEEMVQDTFVRLWRAAPTFDAARGSVRTFVFTIARRAAIDLRRRPSSRPLRRTPTALEIDGLRDRGDDEFDRLITSLEVRDALDTLSDKHRETLMLHYETDLTQPQIARRLGVPVGTVKTRTHYALRALRLELEGREIVV